MPFYGDPNRIKQMLDKLIENAMDFTAAENPITIELRQKNRQALIRISNTGPKLPAKLQGQIFDSMVSIREKSDKNGPRALCGKGNSRVSRRLY